MSKIHKYKVGVKRKGTPTLNLYAVLVDASSGVEAKRKVVQEAALLSQNRKYPKIVTTYAIRLPRDIY